MTKRLLDLFCGAGGASMGYHRAGFQVTGVDSNAKVGKEYPFEFHHGDALEFLAESGHEFDAIHASPPCQTHTRAKHLRVAQGGKVKDTGQDLLEPTRDAIQKHNLPYIIENVPGAPLIDPVQLCGSMFPELHVHDDTGRRWLQRHRLFESNVAISPPGKCQHKAAGVRALGVYHVMNDNVPKGGQTARTLAEGQALMGIDWMRWDFLKEAIPPPYSEHLGKQLMEEIAK